MKKQLAVFAIGAAALAATIVPSSPALAAGQGDHCYYHWNGSAYTVDHYDKDYNFKSTRVTKNVPESCYPY